MNIFEQIEKIFEQDSTLPPPWATELLREIRSIKELLLSSPKKEHNGTDFYRFVKEFRHSMQADTANNVYPDIKYNTKKIGVTFKGLLYDKETSELLPREEAFEVYRYLYDHQQKAV